MKPFHVLLCALLTATLALPAWAIDSEPPFTDPAMQARYERLIHEFRCLVCQDETVADSNADLAAKFRRRIHDLVAAGKSETEIRAYMVARYGNFILYKPPVQTSTWLLWFGPFLFLLIAFAAVALVLRRRNAMLDDAASRQEQLP
ncbi:MAG TPA: cytochrome c-type biogenesis protein [Gammaproteobacteria bacterium]|nr:cytochrome c-type biogenesis protein [Gammaproteobacteria bacterium]